MICAILENVQDRRDLLLGSPLRLATAQEDSPDFGINTPGNRLPTQKKGVDYFLRTPHFSQALPVKSQAVSLNKPGSGWQTGP